jgi:hypothetical protein
MINIFKKISSIFLIFIFLNNTAISNEYINALFECKDANSDHKAYFKMGELNGEKIINIVQSPDKKLFDGVVPMALEKDVNKGINFYIVIQNMNLIELRNYMISYPDLKMFVGTVLIKRQDLKEIEDEKEKMKKLQKKVDVFNKYWKSQTKRNVKLFQCSTKLKLEVK